MSASGGLERYGYDRDGQAVGIVHFGIGAFHRAHQAWYTDLAMDAGDRDWAITGVSLRSANVADQLRPQDGLYTVTARSADKVAPRLVGAVRAVLLGTAEGAAIVAALASATTRIVGFTVTEKGYCRSLDGRLDFDRAGPDSFYPLLAEAFARRRASALPGLTLLSCDNLAENGPQLGRLVSAYLDRHAPDLLPWFESECTCPASMVDRIVPATAGADLVQVAEQIGLVDHAAVVTEPFTQWVIEDRFAGPRPRWEVAGAEFVSDVRPYEAAKLRMLNGAHSLLAYCGLARGHTFVHEAIADLELRALVEQQMLEEAAPTIATAAGQDLGQYSQALIERFANPALNHRLAQIATDGTQKIPQRWLEVLALQRERNRSCPALLCGLGYWLRFVRDEGRALQDPLAQNLASAWEIGGNDGIVDAVLGPMGLLRSRWQPDDSEQSAIAQILRAREVPARVGTA